MLRNFQKILAPELALLEKNLNEELKSNIPLLNIIIAYVLSSKGKQIRPILGILSAKMCGEVQPSTIHAATMIEILHTATLIHDDVVDEADTRRGLPSIFAKWKTKTAVLLGDFMLSRGLLLAIRHDEIELLRLMSESVQEMSEGELLQLEKSKRLNITEDQYYEIISKKTASLIKTACKSGVMSVTKDAQLIALAGELGHHIGMAFQIKDDLLDLSTNNIGKPLTNDIRENKMTLPLIYTLNKVSTYERLKIKGNLRLRSTNHKAIQYIIQAISDNGGLCYSEQKMNEHVQEAKRILKAFPDNIYSKAMNELIQFTIDRSN